MSYVSKQNKSKIKLCIINLPLRTNVESCYSEFNVLSAFSTKIGKLRGNTGQKKIP